MAIELGIMAGQQAGTRRRFESGPVTFGRSRDNTLVIDEPHVSRHQGWVEHDGEHWRLVNQSQRGTFVGSKRVSRSRQRLRDADVIAAGETPLLKVIAARESHTAGETAAGDPAEDTAPGEDGSTEKSTGLSRRGKIWSGIGVYMLLMLGLMVFLLTLDESGASHPGRLKTLSADQIEREIRSLGPSVEKHAPEPRKASSHLERATAHFHLTDSEPDALFKAHRQYRLAKTYSPGGQLQEALHRRRARSVQHRLVERVTDHYQRGRDYYRSRRYQQARTAFEQVRRLYPATGSQRESRVFQNVEAHLTRLRDELSGVR